MLRCIFTVLTASVDNKVVIVVLFHFSYDLRFKVAQSHVNCLYRCGSTNIIITHLVL